MSHNINSESTLQNVNKINIFLCSLKSSVERLPNRKEIISEKYSFLLFEKHDLLV